jgi:hypothetical protein
MARLKDGRADSDEEQHDQQEIGGVRIQRVYKREDLVVGFLANS